MSMLNDFDHYSGDEDEEREVRCKRCGERGLHWEACGSRWRLENNDGETHVCNPEKLSRKTAKAFDILEET